MKLPTTCFESNKSLEDAAKIAEQRKHQALDRLNRKLGIPSEKDDFERAMEALIDADKAALETRGH